MIRPENDVERFFVEDEKFIRNFCRNRQGDEPDLDEAVINGEYDVLGTDFLHFQFDFGIFVDEMGDERRDDGRADHRRYADGQFTGIEQLWRLHFFIQLGESLDEFFDFRKQIGTRFRKLYIFPLAVEELDTPVFFQGFDPFADRRLADVQRF